MTKRNYVRSVVYLDTNSLHYLDLFVRYVQDNGFTVNDIGSEALVKKLEQVDEVGYRQSLQKGRRIISFVLQEDAQVEFSHVSKIELLCGRVRGAVIENAAREGIPDRMWSRIGEKEIRDGSNEKDLERIRRRLGDLGSALEESGIVMGVGSERRQVLDILELATIYCWSGLPECYGQLGLRGRYSGESGGSDNGGRVPVPHRQSYPQPEWPGLGTRPFNGTWRV